MKWGKIVLLFQAVITLVLGIIFLSQVLSLDFAKVTEYNIQVIQENTEEQTSPAYIDIKQRYSSAAYVLLFISLIELIIIIKFLT